MSFHSFKTTTDIDYPLQRGEINCVDISKDFTITSHIQILKKKIIIYIFKKFDMVFDKK